jgi:DnaJ-class molecular chaperone
MGVLTFVWRGGPGRRMDGVRVSTEGTGRIGESIKEVRCWNCGGKGKVAFPLDGPGSATCWAKCRWCQGWGIVKVEVKR